MSEEMTTEKILAAMTPDVYQKLVTAVELGKWQDGSPLTAEQRENSLQAVMLWQARYNEQPDHLTIGMDGELVMLSKQQLKQRFQEEEERIPVTVQTTDR